jgi:hypothetical protein
MVLQYVPVGVYIYICFVIVQYDYVHVATARTGLRWDINVARAPQTPTRKGINIQQDEPKGPPKGSSPSFGARATFCFQLANVREISLGEAKSGPGHSQVGLIRGFGVISIVMEDVLDGLLEDRFPEPPRSPTSSPQRKKNRLNKLTNSTLKARKRERDRLRRQNNRSELHELKYLTAICRTRSSRLDTFS